MYQSKNPREQKGDRHDNKEVAHIESGGVGRKEDRQESQDGNQGSAQQGHGRFLARGRQGVHLTHAILLIDQHTIDNDDGIIDQHTHGQDEGTQRDTLQCSIEGIKHHDRTQHDDNQTVTDDQTGTEAHEDHQDDNHQKNRLHEVNQEGR